MKIAFLPYEHDTYSIGSLAKSISEDKNIESFFFISDFFSQIHSNQYTNRILEELGYDNKKIFDILDEIKKINLIQDENKNIEIDFLFLKNIESRFIDLNLNQLIYKDCHFNDTYHPRDIYYIPKNKNITFKFLELILKKIVRFLESTKPNVVFSFGPNHLIRNIFYQLSKEYNYKFTSIAHTRILNKYYFCDNNVSTTPKIFLDTIEKLIKKNDSFDQGKDLLEKIKYRLFNSQGSYDIENVYNPIILKFSVIKKIYKSLFFKRLKYFFYDWYKHNKLSSHRSFFKSPYFGVKSYPKAYFYSLRNILRNYSSKKFFKKLNTKNLNFKYVYFALHNFPENIVYANKYSNNELFYIIKISKIIPIDWKVIVKPSPIMNLYDIDAQTTEFYEKISRIYNCILCDYEVSAADLIRNSSAVASIAGTNLLEGAILGKPAFRFGEFNLDKLDGIFSFEENSFLEIIKNYKLNEINNHNVFFESIIKNTFDLEFDKFIYSDPVAASNKSFENLFLIPFARNLKKFLFN